MKKALSKRLTTSLLIVSFAFFMMSCKEKEKPSMTGVFTFIKGTVTKNGEITKLGSSVKEGDVLTSKKRSTAVIQFSGGALVTLRGGSELRVSALSQRQDGKKIVSLAQKKGSTFSKIISSEEVDYSVSAPTLTAGVRGTSFELNVSKNGGTEIKLLKGKIAVAPEQKKVGADAKEVLLESGKKMKVTQNHGVSEPQALTKKDVKTLSSLDTIEMVPDIEKVEENAEEGKLEEVVAIPAAVAEVLTEDFQEYTLDDLKKEYGRISKVVTTSGKIYIGNFSQKKKDILIRTTDGQFSISAKRIKKVSAY